MGLFDKAKNSIADRFGDEIVRKGSFGARDSEDAEEPAQEAAPRRRPKQKLPRETRRSRREAQASTIEPEEFRDGAFENDGVANYSLNRDDKPIDAEEFGSLVKDEGQPVTDVLKSLNIPATFTIGDGILFVDEELANLEFATQAPYGYDMGEVDFFLLSVQRSIAEYVRLLRLRNENVMTLAGKISDLLVELNNIRVRSELANGINIMTSGGDEDAMAVDLRDAQMKAAKLQAELDAIHAGEISVNQDSESDELIRLRDELRIQTIKREAAEQDAASLRSFIILYEEENDIQILADSEDDGYGSNFEDSSSRFQDVSGIDNRPEAELYAEESNYQKVGRDHWLPGYDDEGLPEASDEALPDGDYSFDEEGLEEIPLESFEEESGGFEQNHSYQGSAFTPHPYQNLDEFIEDNLSGFPDDNSAAADGTLDDEDPDDEGPAYGFEQFR